MTLASEVSLTMPMNSLPSGGITTRIACGRMIRRKRQQAAHADRLRRLVLADIHREHPGAHDFRGIGALVDAEPEQRREERRHHIHRAARPEAGNADRRKHQREVEPQQQLQDHRRAAEQPGIAAARPRAAPGWATAA